MLILVTSVLFSDFHSENGMFAHDRQCLVILHQSCTQRTREHPRRVLHRKYLVQLGHCAGPCWAPGGAVPNCTHARPRDAPTACPTSTLSTIGT